MREHVKNLAVNSEKTGTKSAILFKPNTGMRSNRVQYLHFAVFKKNENLLAVITNQNTEWEKGHYHEQGYIFLMYVHAFTANGALEIVKQNMNSELGRLQAELSALRFELQKVTNENNNLKFGSQFRDSSQSNNSNPLDVFGFTAMPDKDQLKRRYKVLSQKYHPDREGSNFLMSLINEAYEILKNQAT